MAERRNPKRDFYTTAQVAREVGVTPPTIIKWIRQGKIVASTTPGGHRRIAASELDRLRSGLGRAHEQSVGHPRILIVDSELDFAETVEEYLHLQGGFDPRVAVDPIEIGFLIGTFLPHIILCSVDVPLFGSIVHHGRQIDARVIVMASSPSRSVLTGREDLSECTFVEKPVQLETLLGVIQTLKDNQPMPEVR